MNDAIIDLYDRHARAYDRDRDRSLRERGWLDRFLRHVSPGGTVLDVGCGTGEAVGSYRGEPLYHASLGPEEYARLLAEHGFVVRAHVADDPECGGHTVWLATYDSKGAGPAGRFHRPAGPARHATTRTSRKRHGLPCILPAIPGAGPHVTRPRGRRDQCTRT
ncbi:MAG TPA: hypothetical protein VF158_08740 [Longimicrobiales bacterium]